MDVKTDSPSPIPGGVEVEIDPAKALKKWYENPDGTRTLQIQTGPFSPGAIEAAMKGAVEGANYLARKAATP